MRNITLLSLLALAVLSCKKNESGDAPSLNRTWKSVKTTYIESEYEGSNLIKSDTIIFIGQNGEFLTISSNGVLTWRTIESGSNPDGTVWYGTIFDSWNTTYTRSGTSLNIGDGVDKEYYSITTLNTNKLILESGSTSTSGNRKYVTSGKFEFSE